MRIAQSQIPQDLLTQLSKAAGEGDPSHRAWHCVLCIGIINLRRLCSCATNCPQTGQHVLGLTRESSGCHYLLLLLLLLSLLLLLTASASPQRPFLPYLYYFLFAYFIVLALVEWKLKIFS